MNTAPPTLFPRTLERIAHWKADPEVLGVVWVGSKSRGYGGAKSDDDLRWCASAQSTTRNASTSR